MKKLLLILSISPIIFFSCSNSNIDVVKYGYFDRCPTRTVSEIINGYLDNPEWETFIADNNQRVVNVSGEIYWNNQPANILLQFDLYPNNRWEIYSIDINGVAQYETTIFSIIDNMCVYN